MTAHLDDLLEAIRQLPPSERRRLLAMLRREYPAATRSVDPWAAIGLFADERELIDEVCRSALDARERDPLRTDER